MVPTRQAKDISMTKAVKLLALLRTGTGASLEYVTELTGWQPHTERAAMNGFKKRGHVSTKHVEGNTSVWSVKTAEA